MPTLLAPSCRQHRVWDPSAVLRMQVCSPGLRSALPEGRQTGSRGSETVMQFRGGAGTQLPRLLAQPPTLPAPTADRWPSSLCHS